MCDILYVISNVIKIILVILLPSFITLYHEVVCINHLHFFTPEAGYITEGQIKYISCLFYECHCPLTYL